MNYIYVVIGAYNQPCMAFTTESKANDYVLTLELCREQNHFKGFQFRVVKLCLE